MKQWRPWNKLIDFIICPKCKYNEIWERSLPATSQLICDKCDYKWLEQIYGVCF